MLDPSITPSTRKVPVPFARMVLADKGPWDQRYLRTYYCPSHWPSSSYTDTSASPWPSSTSIHSLLLGISAIRQGRTRHHNSSVTESEGRGPPRPQMLSHVLAKALLSLIFRSLRCHARAFHDRSSSTRSTSSWVSPCTALGPAPQTGHSASGPPLVTQSTVAYSVQQSTPLAEQAHAALLLSLSPVFLFFCRSLSRGKKKVL